MRITNRQMSNLIFALITGSTSIARRQSKDIWQEKWLVKFFIDAFFLYAPRESTPYIHEPEGI